MSVFTFPESWGISTLLLKTTDWRVLVSLYSSLTACSSVGPGGNDTLCVCGLVYLCLKSQGRMGVEQKLSIRFLEILLPTEFSLNPNQTPLIQLVKVMGFTGLKLQPGVLGQGCK